MCAKTRAAWIFLWLPLKSTLKRVITIQKTPQNMRHDGFLSLSLSLFLWPWQKAPAAAPNKDPTNLGLQPSLLLMAHMLPKPIGLEDRIRTAHQLNSGALPHFPQRFILPSAHLSVPHRPPANTIRKAAKQRQRNHLRQRVGAEEQAYQAKRSPHPKQI